LQPYKTNTNFIYKMKKLIILLALTTSTINVAQEKKHEIRIDALEVLVTPAIDVSYEYSLSDGIGIGLSSFFRVDQPEDDFKRFALTPYVRQYFFNNMDFGQKGFYIEAFGQYSNGKREAIIVNDAKVINNYSDFGLGFGGGLKWLASSGFSIDVGAGVGRNFSVKDGAPDFFLRWGIHVGYRFL